MIADRWGVTDAEVARGYPCDVFVPEPAVRGWRGTSVAAPPEAVWPWLAQLRCAPYSYDWIDNLGRRSPQTLRKLPDPQPGDPFTTVAASRPLGEVLAVDVGEQLTARILGATMSYVITPAACGSRLLMKIVTARGRAVGPLLLAGDLVMARRQLLNLAELAEGSAG